jgi:plasmid stabilization system protein ParE
MARRRLLTLVVTTRADEEIGGHFRYIATDSPESALRFLDSVERTARELCEFPRSGRAVERSHLGELRSRQVHGFPNHLLIYIVEKDELILTRVVHAAMHLDDLNAEW